MPKHLQLKISLVGSQPLIWRRLLVPETTTLLVLHYIIQAAFDWENDHLFCFRHQKKIYDGEELEQGPEIPLAFLGLTKESQLAYLYDFGDDWDHMIVVEKTDARDSTQVVTHPVCIAGERAAPPEDSGGIWGYESKCEILADKTHEHYAETVEWMGEVFNPDHFELTGINKALRKLGAMSELS